MAYFAFATSSYTYNLYEKAYTVTVQLGPDLCHDGVYVFVMGHGPT